MGFFWKSKVLDQALRTEAFFRSFTVVLFALFLTLTVFSCGPSQKTDGEKSGAERCVFCHLKEAYRSVAGSLKTPRMMGLQKGVVAPSQIIPGLQPYLGKGPIDTSYTGGIQEELSAKQCRSCHKDHYEQWAESSHGRSWTNPVFQEAFRREPAAWCVFCHAPLEAQGARVRRYDPAANEDEAFDPRSLLPGGAVVGYPSYELMKEGINCAVCHVRNGRIFASRVPSEEAVRKSIHPIYVDEGLQKPAFCAGCHQFPFPEKRSDGIYHTKTTMQDTVQEYYRSTVHAQNSCNDCHFKTHEGKPTHRTLRMNQDPRFPVTGQFRTVAKEDVYLIAGEFRFPETGHDLPTGDLFRQIRISALAKNGEVLAELRLEKKAHVHQSPEILFDRRLDAFASEIRDERGGLQRRFRVQLQTKARPHLCQITHHAQGGIEDTLKGAVAKHPDHYVRVLFRTYCFSL